MSNQPKKYVEQERRSGKTDDDIRKTLIESGWEKQQLDDFFEKETLEVESVKYEEDWHKPAYSLSEQINKAVKIFTENWVTLLGISTVSGLTGLFAQYIFSGKFINSEVIDLLDTTIGDVPMPDISVQSIGIAALSVIIAMIVGFVSQVTLLNTIVNYKEKWGIQTAFEKSMRKVFPFFVITIITALVIYSGVFLLFIGAIVLAFWFSMSGIVYLDEERKGTLALLRSKEIMNKHILEYFGKMVFVALMTGILVSLWSAIIEPLLPAMESKSIMKYLLMQTTLLAPVSYTATILTGSFQFVLYERFKAQLRGKPSEVEEKNTSGIIIGAIVGLIVFAFLILALIGMFISLSKMTDPNVIDSLKEAQSSALDMEKKVDITNIQLSLENYYLEFNNYPEKLYYLENIKVNVPKDPKTDKYYSYETSDDNQEFELCTELSTGEDHCVESY